MLIIKQASFKKIAIYTGIIVVMLSGTAYMVYDNFLAGPPDEGIIFPEMSAEDLAAIELTPEEILAEKPADLSPATTAASSTPSAPAISPKLPGLEIIEDKKFIKLKEIIPEQAISKAGNSNPFKPYE